MSRLSTGQRFSNRLPERADTNSLPMKFCVSLTVLPLSRGLFMELPREVKGAGTVPAAARGETRRHGRGRWMTVPGGNRVPSAWHAAECAPWRRSSRDGCSAELPDAQDPVVKRRHVL